MIARIVLPALALALCAAAGEARAQVAGADPACAGAAAERCYRDGLEAANAALRPDRGMANELPRAMRLLLGACGGGVGDGCYVAALLTESGSAGDTAIAGLTERAARAAYLFGSGCRAAGRPSGLACTAAGFHHAGRPRHLHLDSALHYLRLGCAAGEPAACTRRAELMDEWMVPGAPRSALATQAIREACAARSPVACLSLARRTEERLSRVGWPQRATPAFRRERDEVRRGYARACGDSLPAGCTALGVLHASGALGLPVSPDSARHYLEPACAGDPERGVVGHGAACAALGRILAGIGFGPVHVESPRWAEIDTAAVRWFERGCTLLDAAACADLGYYGYGLGGVGGSLAAFRARTACGEGSGYGCRILGLLAREGAGGEQSQAEQYLRQACALDDGPGCRELAETVGDSTHFKYFRRACALGDGAGCHALAFQVSSAAETGRADSVLLVRACDRADAEACLQLARRAQDVAREVEAGEYHARGCRLDPINCKQKRF
jgi:TPR repeat protein